MQSTSADVRSLFAQAIAHHQAGRLDDAIADYRQVLALRPDLGPARNNLGSALCEQGKLEEAETIYREALALQPDQAELHNNLGTVLVERDGLDDAVACYRKALALDPGYAEALNNLGAALHRQGKLDDAEASIRGALALEPNYPAAHDNLGLVLWQRGRSDQALASTRYALALAPHFPRALNNLGAMLTDLGQLDQAIAAYRRSLEISPRDGEAMTGLARTLGLQGNPALAVETICRSLEIKDSASARSVFVDIVKRQAWARDNHQLHQMMVRALREAWARPGEIARSATGLIKQKTPAAECIACAAQAWPRRLTGPDLFGPTGLAGLDQDELLLALLVSAQNSDIELERFLTMARRALLDAAENSDAHSAGLEFYAALARQCFINEYVFFCDEHETQRAGKLRDALVAQLESQARISDLRLVAVAAYFPLHSLCGNDRLWNLSWPKSIRALLVQQLREPAEEARLRAAIPALAPIEDAVSRSVQRHYEENPYPRWVRIPRREKAVTVAEYLRQKFPPAILGPGSGDTVEILSAGCGTGQLALELAQGMKSRVLAIDLSLKSLGYAARKAEELGVTTIEFAQADLLALGVTGPTFDLIESSGVLHHLTDPFTGWRALVAMLRPGGFMIIGLYSRLGRRAVLEARQRIAQWGYGASADDIRRCRQDLLNPDNNPDPGIAASDDFFGISSCRDLLFHEQEQRLELPAIARFLQDNDLTFLGFEVDETTLLAYRRRFPADPAALDLQNWHMFENEKPDSFSGMYRFWIHKRAAG